MLSQELLRQLDRRMWVSRRPGRGRQKGERRSRALGSSLEFADFRPYVPGDDIRQVDWNLYGRTQKHYVKQFLDEQELQVHLFLDLSRSMDFGEPSKLEIAKQYAASFAYIALAHYDRVSIRPFSHPGAKPFPLTGGKGSVAKVIQYLERLGANQGVEQGFSLSGNLPRMPGLSILISDFLMEPGLLFRNLRILQSLRQEIILLQVLLPQEVNPDYNDDVKLIDSETDESVEVAVSPAVLKEYARTFASHTAALSKYAAGHDMGYVQVTTRETVHEGLNRLWKAGWIK